MEEIGKNTAFFQREGHSKMVTSGSRCAWQLQSWILCDTAYPAPSPISCLILPYY
jgi:hypothetical protein